MRMIAAVLAALVATMTLDTRPAAAQTYPWCTVDMQEGMWSCAYVDKRQCALTASGLGAYCFENPAYRSALTVDELRRKDRKVR